MSRPPAVLLPLRGGEAWGPFSVPFQRQPKAAPGEKGGHLVDHPAGPKRHICAEIPVQSHQGLGDHSRHQRVPRTAAGKHLDAKANTGPCMYQSRRGGFPQRLTDALFKGTAPVNCIKPGLARVGTDTIQHRNANTCIVLFEDWVGHRGRVYSKKPGSKLCLTRAAAIESATDLEQVEKCR